MDDETSVVDDEREEANDWKTEIRLSMSSFKCNDGLQVASDVGRLDCFFCLLAELASEMKSSRNVEITVQIEKKVFSSVHRMDPHWMLGPLVYAVPKHDEAVAPTITCGIAVRFTVVFEAGAYVNTFVKLVVPEKK